MRCGSNMDIDRIGLTNLIKFDIVGKRKVASIQQYIVRKSDTKWWIHLWAKTLKIEFFYMKC